MSCALAASQGGALTQLIALGAADKYLTQSPSITFWRFRYNKHTNFALEAIEQPFNTQVMFGSDTQVTFNRTGDLIYWLYVVIDLPGIYACQTNATCGANPMFQQRFPAFSKPGWCDPCNDEELHATLKTGTPGSCAETTCCAPDPCIFDPNNNPGLPAKPWAHYTNAIGQWLVKRASLVIGGQVIDTLYADYLYMWEELAGKPGKRLVEMIGKDVDVCNLVADSKMDRRLYVPLPFWFTQTSGNALPVVSLQFHGIQLHVCFAPLVECVQTSKLAITNPNPDTEPCQVTVLKCKNSTPLLDQDLVARIETTYVYLDIDERDRFATGSFEQLITQVQAYQICTRSCQVRLALNFNHPILELIWAVRRNCQAAVNNWFCYAGRDCMDPIKYVNLRLNNLPRFSQREGRYFRLVQPYQFHTNIPDAHIYCYSFALNPESEQPSGSCNFSRIDNIELMFDMQDNLDMDALPLTDQNCILGGIGGKANNGDFTVLVFARNWNVIRYREGLGGVAFSN